MKIELKITDPRLKKDASLLPEYKTAGAAGFDLRACAFDIDGEMHHMRKGLEVFPGDTVIISTGIRFWIKDATVAGLQIIRSSLGRRGMELSNGVGLYDSDYQGDVIVNLRNKNRDTVGGGNSIIIEPLERVAQICLCDIQVAEFEVVEEFSESTKRSDGGHGSTGKM